MGTGDSVRVLQVSNISPSATKEQIQTLFSYVGRIEECRVYPSDTSSAQSKFAFVKFEDERGVDVGQHLTNTVFLDRALVCIPSTTNTIPDEYEAVQSGGLMLPGSRQLPPTVTSTEQDAGDGVKLIFTTDPMLTSLGLPQYPPLTAMEPEKVEEIRRTVYIGNIEKGSDPEELLGFINACIGEVMYLRMAAGNEYLPCDYAYVEFSNQQSVPLALQNSDSLAFKGQPLRIQHSKVAIVKPQRKTAEQALEEVEDAIKIGEGRDRMELGRGYSPLRLSSRDRSPRSSRHRSSSRSRRRSSSRSRRRRRHSSSSSSSSSASSADSSSSSTSTRSSSSDRRRSSKRRKRSRSPRRSDRRSRSRSDRKKKRRSSRSRSRDERKSSSKKEKEREKEKSSRDSKREKEKEKSSSSKSKDKEKESSSSSKKDSKTKERKRSRERSTEKESKRSKREEEKEEKTKKKDRDEKGSGGKNKSEKEKKESKKKDKEKAEERGKTSSSAAKTAATIKLEQQLAEDDGASPASAASSRRSIAEQFMRSVKTEDEVNNDGSTNNTAMDAEEEALREKLLERVKRTVKEEQLDQE